MAVIAMIWKMLPELVSVSGVDLYGGFPVPVVACVVIPNPENAPVEAGVDVPKGDAPNVVEVPKVLPVC